jgi:toxin-antitoxin system PIN domain toxin
MTSFFPDINIWLALCVTKHVHNGRATTWLESLIPESQLVFSRYTQLGMLRLLTNEAMMGDFSMSVGTAWAYYDELLSDERVSFHPEPWGIEDTFRQATSGHHSQPATKTIGDCYLIAFARESSSTLVTFDRALAAHAKKFGCRTTIPA